MNPLESFRIAWRSITSHKLRSALTTLGVVIGVAAVIAFTVLGNGFAANVVGDFEEDNEPSLLVYSETQVENGQGFRPVDRPVFTESDVDAIRSIEGVEYAAPSQSVGVVQVERGDEEVTGGFDGEATTVDRFRDAEFEEGGPFAAGANETVVNRQFAAQFDGNLSAGDELRLSFRDGRARNVTVAGVLNESLQFTVSGAPTPRIYLPADRFYSLTVQTPSGEEERAYSGLYVRAESVETVDGVKSDVQTYLDEESDARALKEDDHQLRVQTPGDIVDRITQILDQFASFIVGVAAIALLVGSIGIANIMLVSVTERTREIGIMKAVGARRRDVLQLFLVESIVLGVIGAVLGLLVGVGLGYAGVAYLGWPFEFPTRWAAIAVAVGVGVGILSGVYPAWRGAKVDPIEALRHE